MGKLLERYNLPRLKQEEVENMNRRITSNELETVIKNLPTNKFIRIDIYTLLCIKWKTKKNLLHKKINKIKFKKQKKPSNKQKSRTRRLHR